MNNYYGMPYNPMAPMQQRLNQYEQTYIDPMTKNMVKCRAVTSIDEAKAAMIDLDGSMTIFTDLGNKRIYTKQINLDGTATLNTYELIEKPQEPVQVSSDLSGYVKQAELDRVCENFGRHMEELDRRLQKYENAWKEALTKKKDKSNGGK